ncbi:hypothetical protein [Metabacillus fastidiosus]|uniref:hypothetical protein n=1 Tax=Metabacillus fastidiosus TaxID=1458 RepID=UPI003D286568
MYLSNEAAYDYLKASELSLEFGLIGFQEFMQRIVYLYRMVNPQTPLSRKLKNRIVGYQTKYLVNISNDKIMEEEFANEYQQKSGRQPTVHDKTLTDKRTFEGKENQQKNRYDFKTSTKGIYSKWEFHKGDADPNPSVPHGHSIEERKYHNYKLDSYRGLIYDNNGIYTTKEKRDFIIDLWNNDKFRDFALQAINHFILNNPKYKFRVKNPKVLPRKR